MHAADLHWENGVVRGLHGEVETKFHSGGGTPALRVQTHPSCGYFSFSMRRTIIFLPFSLVLSLVLAASGFAQVGLQVQNSHTTESLRGVSVVSREIAWASGTHGTYLRTTDAGRTWTPGQVPDAGTLDFRGVVAFSADEAFLMSSGPGEQSRIYHTRDAGRHWSLQLLNADPKGFFDSIAFWDATHGVVVGDPVPDDAGTLKFEILLTEDGQNWRRVSATPLPAAKEGEGAFAASNTCIAILPGGSDSNVWFATGGKVARVFHSSDRGASWQVSDTPIVHGPESAGIFSIAFRDAMNGLIVGGDYKKTDEAHSNAARTADGGRTWDGKHECKPSGWMRFMAAGGPGTFET